MLRFEDDFDSYNSDKPDTLVCICCKELFTKINEESDLEVRCIGCQTKYRISNATLMHQNKKFANYMTLKYPDPSPEDWEKRKE